MIKTVAHNEELVNFITIQDEESTTTYMRLPSGKWLLQVINGDWYVVDDVDEHIELDRKLSYYLKK